MTKRTWNWIGACITSGAVLSAATPAGSALASPMSEMKKEAEKLKKKAEKDVGVVKNKTEGAAAAVTHAAGKAGSKLSQESLKLKQQASAFFSSPFRENGKLYYQYAPGKKVRLQTNFGGNATQASTFVYTDQANQATGLPAGISAFADYYDGKAGAAAPPQSVSHKSSQSLIDDQGERGTCVAFASMAAMEALNGKKKLSKNYAYWLFSDGFEANCQSDGAMIPKAAQALRDNGVPEEGWWVYMPLTDYKMRLCPVGPTIPAKKEAKYHAKEIIDLTHGDGETGAFVNNPKFIEAAVDAGYNVVIGVGVAWDSRQNGGLLDYRGVLDVVLDKSGNPVQAEGGHALLIVGYERTGEAAHGGGYVWVKNSWTMLVGEGGYMKLSYDYIRQYGDSGFIITGLK